MLVVTEPKIIYELNRQSLMQKNAVIYNLNANVTNFEQLYLMPPQGMLISSPEFDNAYIGLILSDDNYFVQFMRIIIPLFYGSDVYLLAYNEETVFNPITETILKLIQQRYGYNYQEVHFIYDIDFYIQSSFTTPGALQFDEDQARYESIMSRIDPYSFINERVSE